MNPSLRDQTGVDVSELVPYRSALEDNWRWADFRSRPGDVFVCTPPKCGTTWMQTIVTTLVFGSTDLPAPVASLSPWLEMRPYPIEKVLKRLESQDHTRCIKTHTPADGIPWFQDARYVFVGRDGRDAIMSAHNHMENMRQDVLKLLAESAASEGIDDGPQAPAGGGDVHEFFSEWMQWGQHFRIIASFWERRYEENLLFVHFNDMKSDLDGQMRRVARFLDIEIDEATFPALVDSCTFSSMKSNSERIGAFELFEGGAETFLHKGTNGRWHEALTDEELLAYRSRVEELLTPEAGAWMHGEAMAGVSDTWTSADP